MIFFSFREFDLEVASTASELNHFSLEILKPAVELRAEGQIENTIIFSSLASGINLEPRIVQRAIESILKVYLLMSNQFNYQNLYYEILTIDSELLFLIYLNWNTTLLYLGDELSNL